MASPSRLAQWRRYSRSPKGRARRARYSKTEKRRLAAQRYQKTEAAKATQKRYRESPNGIIMRHLIETRPDRKLRKRLYNQTHGHIRDSRGLTSPLSRS